MAMAVAQGAGFKRHRMDPLGANRTGTTIRKTAPADTRPDTSSLIRGTWPRSANSPLESRTFDILYAYPVYSRMCMPAPFRSIR